MTARSSREIKDAGTNSILGSAHSGSFDIYHCNRCIPRCSFADAIFPSSTDGKHSAAHNQRHRLLCTLNVCGYEACTQLLGNPQKGIDHDAEWIARHHLFRVAICRGTAPFELSLRRSCSLREHKVLATADRIGDRLQRVRSATRSCDEARSHRVPAWWAGGATGSI